MGVVATVIDEGDKHVPHITTLTYRSKPNLFSTTSPSRGSVTFAPCAWLFDGLSAGIMDSTYWDTATIIKQLNISLESLELYDARPTIDTTERLWNIVASYPSIKIIAFCGTGT